MKLSRSFVFVLFLASTAWSSNRITTRTIRSAALQQRSEDDRVEHINYVYGGNVSASALRNCRAYFAVGTSIQRATVCPDGANTPPEIIYTTDSAINSMELDGDDIFIATRSNNVYDIATTSTEEIGMVHLPSGPITKLIIDSEFILAFGADELQIINKTSMTVARVIRTLPNASGAAFVDITTGDERVYILLDDSSEGEQYIYSAPISIFRTEDAPDQWSMVTTPAGVHPKLIHYMHSGLVLAMGSTGRLIIIDVTEAPEMSILANLSLKAIDSRVTVGSVEEMVAADDRLYVLWSSAKARDWPGSISSYQISQGLVRLVNYVEIDDLAPGQMLLENGSLLIVDGQLGYKTLEVSGDGISQPSPGASILMVPDPRAISIHKYVDGGEIAAISTGVSGLWSTERTQSWRESIISRRGVEIDGDLAISSDGEMIGLSRDKITTVSSSGITRTLTISDIDLPIGSQFYKMALAADAIFVVGNEPTGRDQSLGFVARVDIKSLANAIVFTYPRDGLDRPTCLESDGRIVIVCREFDNSLILDVSTNRNFDVVQGTTKLDNIDHATVRDNTFIASHGNSLMWFVVSGGSLLIVGDYTLEGTVTALEAGDGSLVVGEARGLNDVQFGVVALNDSDVNAISQVDRVSIADRVDSMQALGDAFALVSRRAGIFYWNPEVPVVEGATAAYLPLAVR